MTIKKVEMTGSWGLRLPLSLWSVYIFILLPVSRIFLNRIPWVFEYGYDIFLAGALFYILLIRKISPSDLGLSLEHSRQNLLLGGLSGGLILLSLPTLDSLVHLTGLDQTELLEDPITGTQVLNNTWLSIGIILAHAIIEQTIFCGLLVQGLLKKYNPVLVIYAAGVFFTLLQFPIGLGTFIIGLLTAYGYFITGTLLAPLLFQTCCGVAKIMLKILYPRLITLVGFLF